MSAYPIKFGKYLLLERINVGGMAEVFKAKTFGVAGFERILAIKRILPSLIEDDDFVKMFIDEARIAVQLNHANIVQIYELGKHGEHYYIAMEYLPSRDLRSILDKMRMNGQLMSIPQAAYSISKVCEGLDYAHRRRDPSGQPMNIVHRDVSPQNVLVSFEGEIKIIDFGIAKAANRASKTQAGVLKGKFGYMSPEQVRGLPVDRRSDIFAVGVLLYEMLTGERLFVGESDFSTLERVRNADVPPPTLYNKKISSELEQIVLKSLAREVEDRYQWASEFAEDLQRFLIEDRSIYSAKRLAAYMKESYADDIAAERKKMEEFLSVGSDNIDADPPSNAGRASGMPSMADVLAAPKRPAMQPGAPSTPPKPAAQTLDIDDDVVEHEDKTFVIEANEAGLPGVPSVAPPAAARQTTPLPTPENTNDDYLAGASLYGEDDMSDVDDARTMISVSNPFDEGAHDDPPMPAPPAAASVAADDGESARTRPARSSKSGPVARASDERSSSRPIPAATPVPTPVRPTDETAFLPGAPTLQLPAVNPDDDVAGDVEPALGITQTAPDVVDAVEPPPGLSKGARRAIVAGVSVSALAVVVLGLVAALVKGGGGGGDGIAQAVLTASGDAPSELEVLVDGEVVARTLPAAVPLSPDAPHVVRVTAAGREPFEMSLPPLGEGAMQPITVALRPTEGGDLVAAAEPPKKDDAKTPPKEKPGANPKDDAKGEAAPQGDDVPPAAAKGDDAKVDEKKGDDAQGGDAKVDEKKGDDAKVDDAKGEPPADPALSASDGSAWRLSFATIAKDERRSVRGAEVLKDGVIIGRTPFERDFPLELSKVVLRIKADGFVAKDVEFARGDERSIGPATVALTSVAALEGEGGERAPATGSETKPDDAKGVASDGEKPEGNEAGEGERVASAKADARSGDAEPAEGKPPARSSDDSEAKSDKKGAEKASSSSRSDDKRSEARKSDDKKSDDKKSDERKPESRRDAKRDDRSDDKKSDKADKHDKAVTLAIGTRPPAEIFIDKKPHGMAPLMGPKAPSVSVGKHFVMLKEPKSGKKVMLEVTITKPDAKAKIIYRFDDDVVDASGVTVKKK